jgi:glyoxylase-like metal-dependent hydrolase (beta-lactamase superfamily II)
MTLARDRFTRPAAVRHRQLGDYRLTWLPDGVAYLDPHAWYPASSDKMWVEHAHLVNADRRLVASIGALLIEHDDRCVLIDAGFGPMAIPTPFGLMRGGQLLRSLTQAGKTPSDIDAIALTHLHLDHIGWLWHPSTPFAETPVLVGDTEWQHRDDAATDGVAPEMLDTFSGRVRTIEPGAAVLPGVHATATPGHSLGHLAYTLTTGSRRLVCFGDALQSPIQIRHPDLTAAIDDDPAAARNTARTLVDDLTVPGTDGFGPHFADAQFGYVTTAPDGTRTWQPTT